MHEKTMSQDTKIYNKIVFIPLILFHITEKKQWYKNLSWQILLRYPLYEQLAMGKLHI